MKKLVISAITLIAILPSLCAGIDTDKRIREDRRNAMLEERFEKWCYLNGHNYAAMTAYERDVLAGDVWIETDDFQMASDSIDKVLSIVSDINKGM